MRKFRVSSITLLMGLGLLSSSAGYAANWADRTTVSGFASSIFQISDDRVYFNGGKESGVNHDGSFSGTKLGININSRMSDSISLASQILGTQERESFDAKIDWAFIGINFSDDLQLRTGKVKFPVGIVNE